MFGFVFFVALSVVGGKEFTFLCSGICYFFKLLIELFQYLNNFKYIIIFYSSWTKWLWCRYKEGHAIEHWKETQHCYSLELETQRVWDYVGDNYVHRLIQSKTDGKLVELNHYCSHGDGGCEECVADPGFSEALLNSRVEAVLFSSFYVCFLFDQQFTGKFSHSFLCYPQIVNEYNELLTTQLETQKTVSYFLMFHRQINQQSVLLVLDILFFTKLASRTNPKFTD